jgi:hypothetical protein
MTMRWRTADESMARWVKMQRNAELAAVDKGRDKRTVSIKQTF